MKISNYKDIPANNLALPGAKDVQIRVLIGPEDGAPNFVMLQLGIEPGGNTPEHSHEWEEEIFIKAGEGKVKTDEGELPIRGGDVVFFGPDEPHQFMNTGDVPMEFIAVIPRRD